MRIGIVDDLLEDLKILCDMLERYRMEEGKNYEIVCWNSGIEFMESYRGEYDLLFLDIEMPGTNGMDGAREIREKDKHVGIIFVTNMAQYAIQGYEVDAIDFLVKPVGYFNLKKKMDKALRILNTRRQEKMILRTENGYVKISTDDIVYVEKERNYLVYNTVDGQIRIRGSMKDIKDGLKKFYFSECTNGCLVNLKHITQIENQCVCVGATRLSISRGMRKAFMDDYLNLLREDL